MASTSNTTPSSSGSGASASSRELQVPIVKAPYRSSLWAVSPEVASYFVGELVNLVY